MGKIVINITEQKDKDVKISCECMPIIALEIIKKIAENNNIEVYVNSNKMSMASLIASTSGDFDKK